MIPAATALQRRPLVVAAGNLIAGPVHATFLDGDPESLLHSYLVLVRQLRGQQREPSITLRSDDICAIADHLGVSAECVLDDLLDRMGATRAQRKRLFALFAMGALLIVATGSVAVDIASAGALARGSSNGAPVIETVEVFTSSVLAVAGVLDVDAAPVVAAEALLIEVAPEPELALAVGGAEWELMVSLQQLAHALSTSPVADLDVVTVEGVGVADDGSIVAVGPPPMP